jgi:hypothetical protein
MTTPTTSWHGGSPFPAPPPPPPAPSPPYQVGPYSGVVNPNTAAAGGTTGGTASPTGTKDQKDAYADLVNILGDYGLASLAPWAWNEILQGASETQVLLDMRDTPEFKTAFPEIELRKQAGLPAISPGEIVNYRNLATQYMRAAGLPAGFWDSNSDFTNLIASDVSLNELQQRIGLAARSSPPSLERLSGPLRAPSGL